MRERPRIPFCCPVTRQPLAREDAGLRRGDGLLYPFLPGTQAPDFTAAATGGAGHAASAGMYETDQARAIYRNFLDWLFATFRVDEAAWRRDIMARLRLRPGASVLVTGCGLGDDLVPLAANLGDGGEIHAQDLSAAMVRDVALRWQERAQLSCGTAMQLPYADGAFDAAFHFGGINLFDDIGAGIAEMRRVVRPGGRVVFGDEGVAPWLRDTDYGRMVVANIPLWASAVPLAQIPHDATDVSVDWTLGNCFWLVAFTVGEGLPSIDPHVPHRGRRGGTMWTRHHGQLEGVSDATRQAVIAAAAAAGLSVHDWLERTLSEAAQSSSTATPKPERP